LLLELLDADRSQRRYDRGFSALACHFLRGAAKCSSERRKPDSRESNSADHCTPYRWFHPGMDLHYVTLALGEFLLVQIKRGRIARIEPATVGSETTQTTPLGSIFGDRRRCLSGWRGAGAHRDQVGCQQRALRPGDDDKQPGEHQQERPVDLGVDPLALHSPCQQHQANVALTSAGREYIEAIAPALSDIRNAAQAVADHSRKPTGTLRFSCSLAGGRQLLMPFVFIKDEFDAGVRLHEAVPQDMIAMPLGPHTRHVVVGAPSYFANRPRPIAPADLMDHECDGLAPEATRERGRLFRARVDSAAGSFAASAVFDAERDVRLRVAVASGS